MFLIMRLRIPLWLLALGLVAGGGVLWTQQEQITIALERNRDESSDDLGEHVKSISNISSDASNLERINRWNSALRMCKERPVFGWGPGTYMFQYAPFQASEDRTIISTNFGVQGNAHSEYFGPLVGTRCPGHAPDAGARGGHHVHGLALVSAHAAGCGSAYPNVCLSSVWSPTTCTER